MTPDDIAKLATEFRTAEQLHVIMTIETRNRRKRQYRKLKRALIARAADALIDPPLR